MSGAYLSEQIEASDPKRPAPFWSVQAPDRAVVADKLDSLLSRWERQDGG